MQELNSEKLSASNPSLQTESLSLLTRGKNHFRHYSTW